MFCYEEIFSKKSEVRSLSENEDQMIFSVKVGQQTYIRYVSADCSSIILYSFDRPADFVNASVSDDFRLLHLTERMISKCDGNLIYVSTVFDVNNPEIQSRPFECAHKISGYFLKNEKYQILHFIQDKIFHLSLTIKHGSIRVTKIKNGQNMSRIMWFRYFQSDGTISLITKYNDKFYINFNFPNRNMEHKIKKIGHPHPFYGYRFFIASYHRTFCLYQQLFDEKSPVCRVSFYPQRRFMFLTFPDVSSDTPIHFLSFNAIVFVFIPNLYVYLVDMKDIKRIRLQNPFCEMPTSYMVSCFANNYIADLKTGSVYKAMINFHVFRDLSFNNAIEAMAMLCARIRGLEDNFGKKLDFEEETEENSNEAKCEVKKEGKVVRIRHQKSFYSPHKIVFKTLFDIDIDVDTMSQQIPGKVKLGGKFSFSQAGRKLSEANETIDMNQIGLICKKKKEDLINADSFFQKHKSLHNIQPQLQLHQQNQSHLQQQNQSHLQQQNQSPLQQQNQSPLQQQNQSPLQQQNQSQQQKQQCQPQPQIRFQSPSRPTSPPLAAAVEHDKAYTKTVVDKDVLSRFLHFLRSPHEISSFIKIFMSSNSSGACTLPVAPLDLYIKKPYVFYLNVPKEIKEELMQMEVLFPTSSKMSRCEIFSICVKTMMEKRYVLSMGEAVGRSINILRRQNALVVNLHDSFNLFDLVYSARLPKQISSSQFMKSSNILNSSILSNSSNLPNSSNSPNSFYLSNSLESIGENIKLNKFIIMFGFYNELTLLNFPQIPRIELELKENASKFFPKVLINQLLMLDLCGLDFPRDDEFNVSDAKEYWKTRIMPKSVEKSGEKRKVNKKETDGKFQPKRMTKTYMYVRGSDRKVCRIKDLQVL